MPVPDLAVADSAPQMPEPTSAAFSGQRMNELMQQEFEAQSGSEGAYTQTVEHDEDETESPSQDALDPDADDVLTFDNDPQSFKTRVDKVNGKYKAEAEARTAAEARAAELERQLAEERAKFEDYIPESLKKHGINTRAELDAALEAEEKAQAEAERQASIEKQREELYAKYGAEFGEELLQAKLEREALKGELNGLKTERQKFTEFVSAQQANEQATKIIGSVVERVPEHLRDAVGPDVRKLLQGCPVAALPALSDALLELVQNASNAERSAYASTKDRHRDATTPTPEGPGGRSPAPAGAVDWKQQAEDRRLGKTSLSDFLGKM